MRVKTYMKGKTHVICFRKYDSESDADPMDSDTEECKNDEDSVKLEKRTIVEQAEDIGPMFKALKQMIKKGK